MLYMPVFQCSSCGCVENTATSNFWTQRKTPKLCSACDPKIGKWHDRFERKNAFAEGYVTDGRYLYHPEDPDGKGKKKVEDINPTLKLEFKSAWAMDQGGTVHATIAVVATRDLVIWTIRENTTVWRPKTDGRATTHPDPSQYFSSKDNLKRALKFIHNFKHINDLALVELPEKAQVTEDILKIPPKAQRYKCCVCGRVGYSSTCTDAFCGGNCNPIVTP